MRALPYPIKNCGVGFEFVQQGVEFRLPSRLLGAVCIPQGDLRIFHGLYGITVRNLRIGQLNSPTLTRLDIYCPAKRAFHG